MSKVRIYELAKELNISSKDMLNMLAALNIEASSHMMSIDKKLADKVVEQVQLARKKVEQRLSEKNKNNKSNNKKDYRKDNKNRDNRDKRRNDNKSNDNKNFDSKSKKPFNKDNNLKKDNNFKKNEFYKKDDDDNKNNQRRQNKRSNKKEDVLENIVIEKPKLNINNKKKTDNRYKDKRFEDENTDFFEKTRQRERKKKKKKDESTKEINRDVVFNIPETLTVGEFAEIIDVSLNLVIGKLIQLGLMVTQNESIDFETAELIADSFEVKVEKELSNEEVILDEFDIDFEDEEEDLIPRPPVVTVMGHVDHGKTSLLDAIRNARVQKGEAGGITQHIGAYTVNVNGKKITFLDTPGHEAFTSMRARGAQVTDISIIVVAADDGVMPQTIEAINHSKAAGVPIIVAINKMDKPTANPDRIKQELLEEGLTPEDWGGSTICVPVSAKTEIGIDDLLEMILLVSEVEELKANPDRLAVGTIVEAQLDKGRGPVATVLVQKGTLKVGDEIVSGIASGRVRAMFDDKNKSVKKAGPSKPVLILGLSDVPEAGDLLYACEDEKTARNIADRKREILREQELKDKTKVSLDYLYDQIKAGELKDLNIIVKGDVRGSIEALSSSLVKASNEEVKINIIHTGVGGVTEGDVMLAEASNAVIIGFNVRPNLPAIGMAEEKNVDIRTYKVIYEAIEDVENAVKGMLKPVIKEQVIGRAEVRETFKLPNNTIVAGIYVLSGKISRNAKIRILRDDVMIFDGDVSSLRRFKDDVKEVQSGYEAGMSIDRYNDIKVGDAFEAYEMVEVSNG